MASQVARGLSIQESVLARAMSLPYESKQVRFPTVDMPRTSTMVTRDQFTLTASPVTAPGWDNGDLIVAFYGQPGRTLMVYDNITSGSYYVADFAETTSSFDKISRLWYPINMTTGDTIVIASPWPLFSLSAAGAGVPHGPQCPIGTSRHGEFVWMNSGDTFQIVGGGTASAFPTGILEYEIRQWQSADSEPTLAFESFVSLTSGVVPGIHTTSAPGAGYFQLYFAGLKITAGSAGAAMGFEVRVNMSSSAGWMLKSQSAVISALGGDPVIGLNARVNGSSLLLTNTTSVLNRQGTVLAARIQEVDPANVTPQILQRSAEKYTGDAAKGVYTFKEFTPYSEDFRRHTATAGGASSLFYDLDYNDFYHFIQITCPSVSTAANTYTVSVDMAMEFRSDVERYPKDVSMHAHGALIEARRLINSNPVWFYENPLHMAQIYNLIQRGVNGVRRGLATYGPTAARVASVLDPAHSGGYEALATLMRSLAV